MTEIKKAVGYGSLYMDDGETIESAFEQIDRVIEKSGGPDIFDAFFFDVICTPEQLQSAEGDKAAHVIEEYLRKVLPNANKVSAGAGLEAEGRKR